MFKSQQNPEKSWNSEVSKNNPGESIEPTFLTINTRCLYNVEF